MSWVTIWLYFLLPFSRFRFQIVHSLWVNLKFWGLVIRKSTYKIIDDRDLNPMILLPTILPNTYFVSKSLCNQWILTPGRDSTITTEYGYDTIFIDVDISDCGFVKIPTITTSLEGNGKHYEGTGTSSLSSASASWFRMYIEMATYAVEGVGDAAKRLRWNVEWVAVGYICWEDTVTENIPWNTRHTARLDTINSACFMLFSWQISRIKIVENLNKHTCNRGFTFRSEKKIYQLSPLKLHNWLYRMSTIRLYKLDNILTGLYKLTLEQILKVPKLLLVDLAPLFLPLDNFEIITIFSWHGGCPIL